MFQIHYIAGNKTEKMTGGENIKGKGSFTVIKFMKAYREYARGGGLGPLNAFFPENQHLILYH